MPVLEILTQPVEHHRPRYESEISTNKIGGLLLGRGSTGKDNKAFVKLKISGIDPAVHRELQLFACVASQNGELHPYYLHGDGCTDGCFFWVKQVDNRTPSEIEIKFERLAVIRCKTSSDAIQEALKKREEQVQGCLLPNGLNQPAQKYNGRNLGSIRLVFQLSFSDNGYCHYLQPIFSDVIADITQMPIKEEIRVVFELSVESSETTVRVSGCVKKVMKHLIIVTVPGVQMYVNTERTKAKVLVEQNLAKTEDSTNSALTIAFLPGGWSTGCQDSSEATRYCLACAGKDLTFMPLAAN